MVTFVSNVNQKSQQFTRVAECLFKNGIGIYLAKVRVQNKQIKKSLETSDLQIAKRRLAALGKRQDG